MTATNPLHRAPTAAPRAIFIQCIDRILAAGRLIPAVAAHEMSERRAIQQNELDE
jgi:hypothetical protein